MAIKEFIIGPQNYFEAGYFDGDYTLPNVSKTFLECDIDNIKGGRVVTGLYYEDNYIDGSYWHDNSIRATLSADFIIVQEASVSLQGYYQEGYYETGYHEQRGSQFFLSATLEKVGITVEASGSFEVISDISINAGKQVDIASAISAEFNQTVSPQKLKEIVLFAFNEAAIAVQLNVVASANIELSTQFNVATDASRIRNIDSSEDAVFDIITINERSRAFDINTQTAFSFIAVKDRLRGITSDLTSLATLTATISHIEGADIVIEGFGSLTCQIDDRTRSMSSAMSVVADTVIDNSRIRDIPISASFSGFQTCDNRRIRFGVAALNSISSIVIDAEGYKGVGVLSFNSATTASITARENPQAPAANPFYGNPYPERVEIDVAYDYVYDRQAYTTLISADPNRINKAFWFYAEAGTNLTAEAVFSDTTGGTNSATASISFTVNEKDFSGQTDFRYLKKRYTINAGVVETITNLGTGLTNGSGTIKIILDKDTTNYITVYANGSTTPQTLTNIVVTDLYYTNLTFDFGLRTRFPPPIVFENFTGSVISYPDGQPSRDLNLLSISSQSLNEYWETLLYSAQEYAVADLVSTNFGSLSAIGLNVQNAQASLTATATQTVIDGRVRFNSADLSSQFARLIIVTELSDLDADLQVQSTMVTDGQILRLLANSNISSEFTQSITENRIRYGEATATCSSTLNADVVITSAGSTNLTATTATSIDANRIRDLEPQLDSIATQLTVAFRNATGTILLEAETQLSATVELQAFGTIVLSSIATLASSIDKTTGYSAELSSNAELSADIDKILTASAELSSETTAVTVSDDSKIAGIIETFAAITSLTVITDRSRDVISLEVSAASLVCDNQIVKESQATLASEFSIFSSPNFVIRISTNLTAFNAVLALGDVINIDPCRTIRVPQETRIIKTLPESRIITVEQETRINIIKCEERR